MGAGTFGMNNAFGYAFSVEVREKIDEMVVYQRHAEVSSLDLMEVVLANLPCSRRGPLTPTRWA